MKINTKTEERIKGQTPKYNKGTLPRSNDLDEMVKTVGQAQVGFATVPLSRYHGQLFS